MRTALSLFVASALVAGCNPTSPTQDAANDTGNDVPVATDAENDAPADTSSGNCSLVGTWQGTLPGGPFAGMQITWTFVAGGVWNGTFGSATMNGTWVQNGNSATLTDTSSVPTYVACPATQMGVYNLTFNATCATVAWAASMEPCDGRHVAVDTLSVTRQ